ncbi:hypothetical protein BS17DRAFT_795723 [Gyrodon lividus]|nr:hypothetical protein BS17DRAFT_795723 [Gyrodon lividus]
MKPFAIQLNLIGAQLYDSKESDHWIYMWIILNLSPDKCYRNPNKPKNVDSFLFPGFHHFDAIPNEGLPMWDPLTDSCYVSNLYLMFTTTNGPGLVYWDGMVGHSGKNRCCLYWGILGQHKDGANHYYPALLCLHDHIVPRSDHPDVDVFEVPQGGSAGYAENLMKIISVQNQIQWDRTKMQTSLTTPTYSCFNIDATGTDDKSTWNWAVL